ncbi:MAG: hypothetical protein Q9227_004223 [Pyrenula ochraceoflavens]
MTTETRAPSNPSFEPLPSSLASPRSPNQPPALPLKELGENVGRRPTIPRKPLPIAHDDEAVVQDSPQTPVRVHPPPGHEQPQSFSVPIEDHGSQISPSHSRATSGTQSILEPHHNTGESGRATPQTLPFRPSPLHHDLDSKTLPPDPESRSSPSSIAQLKPAESDFKENERQRPPSQNINDFAAQNEESFQPLQYFHQQFEDNQRPRTANKRVSRLTGRSSISDGASIISDGGHDQYLAPFAREGRGSLPRPDSVLSSNSEIGRGRTRSPQLTPGSYARARSTHSLSASPDVRPLSYVDLLNVPYPQPAPAAHDNLQNTSLRRAVGDNAELLSTRKTLDMYRENAKKTNDPAVAYEFAVFMISVAQEARLEDELSSSGRSDKSSTNSRESLLKEAQKILQRLSDRSYPFAQYYLADGFSSGLFNKGKEDYEKAFPLFVSASKHGHAEASYRAALCYEFGWGSKVDAAKAVQFYRQAAAKNHPGAMLRLGRACLTGDLGLGKKYREGVKWLKRAAESADYQYNSAPYELGVLHETGYGDDIFPDESYAAQLFTKSADLGHPEANYRLGDAYEHGKLTCPRDPALSVHFYTGAAQRNHPLAMMALCAWYMVGAEPVLEKDENEAYEWARKAAEEGLPKAEYAAGYFTEMGIGCRRDPLEANVWYVRAADHGDERAKHRIHAIRAASMGADPVTAALPNKSKGDSDNRKSKKFGIF